MIPFLKLSIRGGAGAARQPHKLQVGGANPSPVTFASRPETPDWRLWLGEALGLLLWLGLVLAALVLV